ncbi:EscV/YscV/HrcV family type III secretion system export apparatus protein [Pantoea cypripedii]|uniref:EscV/YscV/HrcV family type III secretion system export apparatus protein n=1 Tax=Pantoea cypripedii TaxID=55209 RepID=UPI002FCAE4C7
MLNKLGFSTFIKPELAIVTLIGMVIAMLIIPLPPRLIDFLIGLNIALALLIFLSSLYVNDLIQFSTFPAVLLISTLFRLALSISTSRLILLDGYAGEVVSTFGQFVIGGSLAVGVVIFFIVTIVQFIVITKGSERVAEVCARFSLDGMPGKQMSIDGDLKANTLTSEQATAKRKRLEQESQLFGSMDGAMRFVKGDAIAGLLIILVNFVGGILIAQHSYGLSFSEALDIYTMLTIGDGLVAQIPALLISIGAGFVVTRVNDDNKNLGASIVLQLFSNTFVMGGACVMILIVGLLPGFPFVVFGSLAAMLGLVMLIKLDGKFKSQLVTGLQRAGLMRTDEEIKAEKEAQAKTDEQAEGQLFPETIPVMLVMAPQTYHWLNQPEHMAWFRQAFFLEFGIPLPRTELLAKEDMAEGTVKLLIHEIDVDHVQVLQGQHRILSIEQLPLLESLEIPATRLERTPPQFWCAEAYASQLTQLNIQTRNSREEIYRLMSRGLSRLVNEYFGIQDTKEMLDKIDSKAPELMKEVYRNATVQRISEIFQRLISEGISLRNNKIILETIAQHAGKEKDNLALTELVRGRLARYISNKYQHRGLIRCVMMTQGVEEEIRRNIKSSGSGSSFNMDPGQMEEIFSLFTSAIAETAFAADELVIMCSMDIRRFVKKLLENKFTDLDVLSWQEISDHSQLQILATV